MALTEDQLFLRKRLAKNLHSAFDKSLENAPVLSDFLGALAIAGQSTDDRSKRALLELLLDQAAGQWLDLWGYMFRVYPRILDELDADYRARIILETIRPRMNEISIEDVFNDDPTQHATAFTPLTRVVFASQRGSASTGWHCADGRYWHGCVIDVGVDNYNQTLDYLLTRNRAAGILAWITARVRQLLHYGAVISSSDGVSVISARTFMIRGNNMAEDITNENELVGKGFLIANAQVTEETV